MLIKSESLKSLAAALVKAQKKMGAAVKDSKNPFFKSMFADLNSVIEASVPVLNDEDIAVLQNPMVKDNGKFVMQTILLHTTGEYIASETEITPAKVNDPQATGSAISYARRYGLQSTVTLRAEDSDAEDAMGRGAPRPTGKYPKPTVQAKAVEEKVDTSATLGPAAIAATNEAPKKKVSFSKKAFETATASSTSDDL